MKEILKRNIKEKLNQRLISTIEDGEKDNYMFFAMHVFDAQHMYALSLLILFFFFFFCRSLYYAHTRVVWCPHLLKAKIR